MMLRDALVPVRDARREQDVVITTMGPAREWMSLGVQPLDLVLVPSAMSHATSMGLGLALAQPERRVIVCNGDGSMLMNLGSLASIADAGATNLVVIVFDNGAYEVTGGQPTPLAHRVRFVDVARACGWSSTFRFDDLAEWRAGAADAIAAPGPVLIALEIASVPGTPGPKSPGLARDRAQRFMRALGSR
jgi:thiamine pyrophosphate-dependent acetolactate synthase large subunit-like protein